MATMTETITTTTIDTVPVKKDPHRYRPKSTWHEKPVKNLSTFVAKLALSPDFTYEIGNEEKLKYEIPPYVAPYVDILYIFAGAGAPVIGQWLVYTYFPQFSNWPWYVAYIWYHGAATLFSIGAALIINSRVAKYGVLDRENRPRDRIPDADVDTVGLGIIIATMYRTALITLMWDPKAIPSISLWIFPKIVLFQIILDYFFYTYHRLMHEVDILWQFHKKHHSTSHPTIGMSILADHVQELFDAFVIPLGAQLVFPLPFHELYIAIMATIYVEASGHSGLRADATHPLNGFIMRQLDCTGVFYIRVYTILISIGVVEDHDLHHRGNMHPNSQTESDLS